MGSALPLGDIVPAGGPLVNADVHESVERNFGMYIHIPFCRVRCGYCDFNTYTASQLRGLDQQDYAGVAETEIRLAARELDDAGAPRRPLSTVFFGGGTPTLLPPRQLIGLLDTAREVFGIVDGAEVTVEANPDSIDAAGLASLAAGGVTRVSFGMQSAVPSVLATLERTHTPSRVPQVVDWALEAGLRPSVDVIYGAPGETLDDWKTTVDAVLALPVDHISAYALIVEEGTSMARKIRRGEYPEPDDDLTADKYILADEAFRAAGFDWYELSNWARTPADESRHNRSYWENADWWGVGPGAHSHVGDMRWWNAKHPAAYAERLATGSPAVGRERIGPSMEYEERVLLESRLRTGLAVRTLQPAGIKALPGLVDDGLIDTQAVSAGAGSGVVRLTLRGRLLADLVVRQLLDYN